MNPRGRFKRAAAGVEAMLFCLALCAVPVAAKDLGVHGASWPVTEADLLTVISERVGEMSENGEWEMLEKEARERTRRSLETPAPVAGVFPATEPRVRRFDPTITVAEDLMGPNDEVIAAAGARINPLVLSPLSAELLFIDGRREAEVAWALERVRAGGGSGTANADTNTNTKIILLAGRPLDLMRRHRLPFYFDLDGRLSARFGIRATPTRMVRDGLFLRLTEIPLADSPITPASRPEPVRERETEKLNEPREPDPRRQNPC